MRNGHVGILAAEIHSRTTLSAELFDVSLRTVERDWEKARMLLLALLGDDAA